jgi:hypothetical protein
MTNTTHTDLLAALDDCLADEDPKVRREARKIAADCLADTRVHLSVLRSLGMTRRDPEVIRLYAELADFRRRAEGR